MRVSIVSQTAVLETAARSLNGPSHWALKSSTILFRLSGKEIVGEPMVSPGHEGG